MGNFFLDSAKEAISGLRSDLEAIALEQSQLAERRRIVMVQIQALTAYIEASELNRMPKSMPLPMPRPPSSMLRAAEVTQKLDDLDDLVGIRAKTSFKDLVLPIIERILADGRPRPTKELVDIIKLEGVAVHGVDPVMTISAILSREKDRFVADRKHGWSLKEKSLDTDGTEAFEDLI